MGFHGRYNGMGGAPAGGPPSGRDLRAVERMPASNQCGRRAAIVAIVALAANCAGDALATSLDMSRLPVVVPNLCASCHTAATPTAGNARLNPFGLDFRANGRVWDSDLAALDSDGDGCLNGIEVGDSDGDGRPDGNVTSQAGNPGLPGDCGSGPPFDETTWGAIKAMFDGR